MHAGLHVVSIASIGALVVWALAVAACGNSVRQTSVDDKTAGAEPPAAATHTAARAAPTPGAADAPSTSVREPSATAAPLDTATPELDETLIAASATSYNASATAAAEATQPPVVPTATATVPPGRQPLTFSAGELLTNADLAQRPAGDAPSGPFLARRLIIRRIGVDAPFMVRVVGAGPHAGAGKLRRRRLVRLLAVAWTRWSPGCRR